MTCRRPPPPKQNCLTHRSPPGSGQNCEGCGGPGGEWTSGVTTRGASASQSEKLNLTMKTQERKKIRNILETNVYRKIYFQMCTHSFVSPSNFI